MVKGFTGLTVDDPERVTEAIVGTHYIAMRKTYEIFSKNTLLSSMHSVKPVESKVTPLSLALDTIECIQ